MFKEKGFTIIEMMVVISLIAAITSFTFISYWSMDYDLSFERKMGEVSQTIRKARDYAIASWYPLHLDTGGDFHGGYGVKFDVDKGDYILFADFENEETFTENSVEMEKLKLEEGMRVEEIDINGVSVDHLYLVFRSPDLDIFFNGNSAINNDLTAVVVFGSDAVSYKREIKINPYGVPTYEK